MTSSARADWSFTRTVSRKRLRLTAEVKTVNVETNASLWMRVDAPTSMAFDNMMNGAVLLTGDRDWTKLSVVLDVPADATRIHRAAS